MDSPKEKAAQMDGCREIGYLLRMTDRNRMGILYAVCFILFAVVMTGLHWLMTGINADFGTGVAVGVALGMGVLALASKRVRESD